MSTTGTSGSPPGAPGDSGAVAANTPISGEVSSAPGDTVGVAPAMEVVEEREPGRKDGSFLAWLRESVLVVALALALSLVVKTFLLQAFYIPSASMEDTLLKGDRVIVSKLTPSPFDLKRGDVVVFEDPAHWLEPQVQPQRSLLGTATHDLLTFVGLLPNDSGNHLIKRVIGLPGDRVVCCGSDGRLVVNGTPVEETYLKPGDVPSTMRFSITVPTGRVWVMGDHRSDSGDSRFHDNGKGTTGSVPVGLIVGRAVIVVWPLHDVQWLSRGSGTFDSVPAPKPAAKATTRSAPRQSPRPSSGATTR